MLRVVLLPMPPIHEPTLRTGEHLERDRGRRLLAMWEDHASSAVSRPDNFPSSAVRASGELI